MTERNVPQSHRAPRTRNVPYERSKLKADNSKFNRNSVSINLLSVASERHVVVLIFCFHFLVGEKKERIIFFHQVKFTAQ